MKPLPTDPSAQTDLRMRTRLHTLVAEQQAALAVGLPPWDRAGHEAALAGFPVWCVQREHGIDWSAAEQAAWQRVSDLLLAGVQAQAQALDGGLVALLRDPALDGDEAQEIDGVVRWWDAARLAGLPVDADFGACWRAFEWLGLVHDLSALGRVCCARHRDGAAAPAPAELARLLAHASRVALRYGPLKPLLRLLEPLSGARAQAGFTF